jgi:radical SAM superfamily enzyme YgiQ (UPF0313 family)
MLKIQLAQVNFIYGNNAYLPYSVGLLQANLQSDLFIANNCEFMPIIFLREEIEVAASKAACADILGISCYIWNWEYSKTLARRVKELNPKIKIIGGGPQIPHKDEELFKKHPFFDLVVIGEGELTFNEFVRNFIIDPNFDFSTINGIAFQKEGQYILNPGRSRLNEINEIPSPYLENVFGELIANYDLDFQVSQETHRGCPYSCTFCDWGSATMQKVKRFSKERIFSEYEWMAKNRIEVLYNCDANYGLFPEDRELTDRLVETKNKSGWPKKFRAAYAKNSNERVFEIAQKLNDAGMSKGVTLSLQSLDELTLDLIKRRNMKINDFRSLINTYTNEGIPTYTELILGLPGESKQSFMAGIDVLFQAGQHNGLNIYPAMVLPNAQFNDENYKKLHGIKFVETPMLLSHGTPEVGGIQERYEIVIKTNDLPVEDWIDSIIYAWVVQALHCMNLTQQIARYLNRFKNISYTEFYSSIISWSKNSIVLNGNIELLKSTASDVAKGTGSLVIEDFRFGNIVWPVEEILFLRLWADGFTGDLVPFLTAEFGLEQDLAEELVHYQVFSLRSHISKKGDKQKFSFNFLKLLDDNFPEIGEEKEEITIVNLSDSEFANLEDYAREVVWYGRKGSTMVNKLEIFEI